MIWAGVPQSWEGLLEQAEAVAVSVVEVAQAGFLHGGGDGDHLAAFGNLHPFADRHDDGGVGGLFRAVSGDGCGGGTGCRAGGGPGVESAKSAAE
jgi:hypothetical protein